MRLDLGQRYAMLAASCKKVAAVAAARDRLAGIVGLLMENKTHIYLSS